MLLDLDPFLIRIGGFGIRWYGFLMAVSMGIGLYFFVRNGVRAGFREDFLYNTAFFALAAGIVGARLIYVIANNPGDYLANPVEILRIDHGGLSWHGGIGGGLLAGWLYIRRLPVSVTGERASFAALADLAVPGLAVGYILVRIANIFNREVLGNPATVLLPFGLDRHPAQIYGSLIGLVLLLIHNRLTRRNPPPGYLFWGFFFYYSLLRGFIEETFRANPHFLIDVRDPVTGIGFTTMTQLFTPLFLAVTYLLMRASLRQRAGAVGGR